MYLVAVYLVLVPNHHHRHPCLSFEGSNFHPVRKYVLFWQSNLQFAVNKTYSLVCIYIYVYIYMYVCMYVCMSVCLCVCMSVCMYVCMHAWMDGCMYGWLHAWMHACMHARTDVCIK